MSAVGPCQKCGGSCGVGFYSAANLRLCDACVQGAGNPIHVLLWCPECGARHVDVGEFATKVHHTHACQTCGHVWRPSIVPTVGVQFLPGFKNFVPGQGYDRNGVMCGHCGGRGCEPFCTEGGCQCETGRADMEIA